MTDFVDDRRAKRNVAVLVAAQAFLGSQIPMLFIIAGLAGQQLTPFACLATLPISLIVFGSMTTAPWLSNVMQTYGRRAGFCIGATGGGVGAAICAWALSLDNFWLFLGGSYLTGIYMSSQGFFRFAAADSASDTFRPKAISYVMAGGLISALIGPQIVAYLTANNADASVMRYQPIYLAVITLNVVGMGFFFLLDLPKQVVAKAQAVVQLTRMEMLADPRILVAIICAAVSYALMNLVMTSTPLAVVGCGYTEPDAANVVMGHVLAMFAPSFFTGHLIARFGVERITGLGLVILFFAGVVALSGVELTQFYIALVLLGLGWNFGFIGATTMLTSSYAPEERGRIQGMNDLIVFGSVTVASLASGGLMNCVGADPVSGWTAVNLAMGPFLLIAGSALVWLVMRQRRPAI